MRAPAVLLSGALLWGCATDRTAEGPGSETSGLSARIVFPDGAPAEGVWVRARDLSGWTARMRAGLGDVLDSQRTDAGGRVRFPGLAASRVALEAEASTGAARAESVPGATDSVVTMRLRPRGSLRVAVAAGGPAIRWAALVGGGRAVPSGNAWDFGARAAGWYSVVVATDSGIVLAGRARVEEGRATDTSLSVDDGAVLLDDFVRPSPRNRWGDLLGQGWWYSTVDAGEGGTSRVAPEGAEEAWTSSGCPGGAPGCLHFAFSVDTLSPVRYALVGQDLDASRLGPDSALAWIDPSKTDSVVLVVRGEGEFAVQFPSRDAAGRGFQFRAGLRLPPGWSRVAIPVDSFRSDAGTGPAWKDGGWRATGLVLLTRSPADLWIASISLVGPSARDLFPELRARPGDFP